MNAEPHTHQVELRRRYPSLGTGPWVVKYGDTEVVANRFAATSTATRALPSRRRIDKVIAKAIAKHDAGSIDAGSEDNQVKQVKQMLSDLNNHLVADHGRWGKQVLDDHHGH